MQPVDFAIITALAKEAQAVVSRLEQPTTRRFEAEDIRTYHYGTISFQAPGQFYRVVVITLPNMGTVSAANAVTDTIARWSPRFVLMVGIAGGIPQGDLDLGDVVIADQVVGYDYGKVTESGIQPRPRVYPASALLLDRIHNFWDNAWEQQVNVARPVNARRPISKRWVGPIASGNKVIASTEFRNQLLAQWPKLLAVEMEAEGVFGAIFDRPHIRGALVIRGICDMADERKSDEWQEYAANAAAAFVVAFLKSSPVEPIDASAEERQTEPSQKYHITINEAHGVVIGDQAHIVQRFTSEPVARERGFEVASSSPAQFMEIPGKTYRTLIGREPIIGDIIAALRDPGGKWLVGIDGMGGIGKTAMANEVIDRSQAEHLFDMVVWESAPKLERLHDTQAIGGLTFDTVLDGIGRQLGALDVPKLKSQDKEARVRTLLHNQRVLVVLDNLETAHESQNEIARRLQPFLNPGKALMTSRHRFKGDVYAVHLSGLDETSAIRFIYQEAEEKNISRIKVAEQSEFQQIAQSTGGSPLALKLVVGQLGHLSLDTVLNQLSKIRPPDSDTNEDDYLLFYKGIFFSSWQILSDAGKQLLISMAHFAPGVGGTSEAIQATSDLANDVLTRSIDELWRLSFLEIGESPSLNKLRYYLHALTQNFILSDVVQILK
ncbi:5'-methylthioadenosine/S-adenosylhomocysteine nucleosidase [Thermoflexales bacterium]|nr:5'-methylthioadenosine/S-adenosylhomocysteine nucleosidase [Thermoflexales bacterium]